MRRVRVRLLVGSLVAALVLGVAGGYVVSRLGDDDDLDVSLDSPGVAAPPDTIGTALDLEGSRFPDVEVSDREGAVVSTASFVGEPLVVNFWFSTCPPCERELPDFAEVDAETGDAVRFVGINTADSVQVMERFAGERGVDYDLFRDDAAELQQALDVAFFPYTVFVASDGTIVDQTGVLDADGLRERVDALLEHEGEAEA